MTNFRVLIVDDAPGARLYLRTILGGTGAQCIEASNGLDALRLAGSRIDLVISDIQMPVLDGLELLARIEEGALGQPPPPVILCSARLHEASVRQQADRAGCSGMISKPFRPGEIIDQIRLLFPDRPAS